MKIQLMHINNDEGKSTMNDSLYESNVNNAKVTDFAVLCGATYDSNTRYGKYLPVQIDENCFCKEAFLDNLKDRYAIRLEMIDVPYEISGDKDEFEFGFYPRNIADSSIKSELSKTLYDNKKSDNIYHLINTVHGLLPTIKYNESLYVFLGKNICHTNVVLSNNKKIRRFSNGSWIKIEPVVWKKVSDNYYVSKECLAKMIWFRFPNAVEYYQVDNIVSNMIQFYPKEAQNKIYEYLENNNNKSLSRKK